MSSNRHAAQRLRATHPNIYLHKNDLMNRLLILNNSAVFLFNCAANVHARWPWVPFSPSSACNAEVNFNVSKPNCCCKRLLQSAANLLTNMRADVITGWRLCCCKSIQLNIRAAVQMFLFYELQGKKAGEEFPLQPGSQWSLLHSLTWVSPDSF